MVETKTLKKIPRFSGLSESALRWLSERSHIVKVPEGQTLFFEGEACNHLYLIETGSIRIYKILESGRELTLDFFYPGDAVGEVALIDGLEFPANALALEDSLVIKTDRKDYFTFLTSFPEASLAVIRDLSLRMRTLNRRVQELGAGEVESRLAHVLLAFAKRLGSAANEAEVPGTVHLHLSRQEMSSMVGARIETVIRTISRWKKSGIVIKSSEGITFRMDLLNARLSELEHEKE